MKYLQLLDAIRSITGRRRHDSFPATQQTVGVFRRDGGGSSTFVVYDAHHSKAVLQSSRYSQINFLEQILTIAKPSNTEWIRRFCEIGLIMVDGPEHQRRRGLMQQSLDRCAAGVKGLSEDRVGAVIEDAVAAELCSSAAIASRLVTLLFSRSVEALSGRPVALPEQDLFAVDFFNPFPTLSSLADCNAAIRKCCEAIDVESLEEPDQAAVLSLLIMGVSPLRALLTALINAYISARRAGLTADGAMKQISDLDSYAIVPTNFVMRVCVADDMIGQERVAPGDILYLFLGSATGCPFSRRTTVPFGAGRHYCSGAGLTQAMAHAVRAGLVRFNTDFSRITLSKEVEGKAAAFLTYATQY